VRSFVADGVLRSRAPCPRFPTPACAGVDPPLPAGQAGRLKVAPREAAEPREVPH
jgi:hypothetical protein